MNLDLKDIPSKITLLLTKLKSYTGFLVLIGVLLAYSFLVLQIRNFVFQSPDETKVLEELNALNIPKVDEEAIKKIEQLESTNVEVKALFEQARNNPFQE